MIRLQAAACAAMVLAGTAVAQTRPGSATYQMRLVPQGEASGIVSGGVSTFTSFTFVVQARATTAAGTTNYGVHRLSSGTITATNATLSRATSNGTNFGRFRGPGMLNIFAAQIAGSGSNSATGNSPSADPVTNVNGRLAADGRSIGQIDAWRGRFAPADDAKTGDPLPNPFLGTLVTDGSPSVWANLYAVTVNMDAPGGVVTVAGFLNIAAHCEVIGQWVVDPLTSPTEVMASFLLPVPSPSAAALLGVGGLLTARRRR